MTTSIILLHQLRASLFTNKIMIKYNSKRLGFFLLCKAQLSILTHIIVNELCKKILLLIWFLNFIFDNLVLIEDQLILIFYKNKKGVKYRWRGINFIKNAFWSLNFKNHANYIVLVPQIFFYSILIWHRFRSPKQTICVSNGSIW
jgi:hypothetical protein